MHAPKRAINMQIGWSFNMGHAETCAVIWKCVLLQLRGAWSAI